MAATSPSNNPNPQTQNVVVPSNYTIHDIDPEPIIESDQQHSPSLQHEPTQTPHPQSVRKKPKMITKRTKFGVQVAHFRHQQTVDSSCEDEEDSHIATTTAEKRKSSGCVKPKKKSTRLESDLVPENENLNDASKQNVVCSVLTRSASKQLASPSRCAAVEDVSKLVEASNQGCGVTNMPLQSPPNNTMAIDVSNTPAPKKSQSPIENMEAHPDPETQSPTEVVEARPESKQPTIERTQMHDGFIRQSRRIAKTKTTDDVSQEQCGAAYVSHKMFPKPLSKLVKELNGDQKQVIKNLGFGVFLGVKIKELPTGFCFWLLEHFSPYDCYLRLSNGEKFSISVSDVEDVFGLPNGGEDVLKPSQHDPSNLKQLRELWHLSSGNMTTVDMAKGLPDLGVEDDFKRNFVLFIVSRFISGNMKEMCDTSLLSSLRDTSKIPQLNWCQYTFDCLISSTHTWHVQRHQNPNYNSFDGPLHLLMCCFFDKVCLMGKIYKTICPTITFWTSEDVTKRPSCEEEAGEFGLGRVVSRYKTEEDLDPSASEQRRELLQEEDIEPASEDCAKLCKAATSLLSSLRVCKDTFVDVRGKCISSEAVGKLSTLECATVRATLDFVGSLSNARPLQPPQLIRDDCEPVLCGRLIAETCGAMAEASMEFKKTKKPVGESSSAFPQSTHDSPTQVILPIHEENAPVKENSASPVQFLGSLLPSELSKNDEKVKTRLWKMGGNEDCSH